MLLLNEELVGLTQICLNSIEQCTPQPHEVILVDNGSPSEFRDPADLLLDQADVGIRFKENRGYGPAINAGFRIAKGLYLVALNNDAEVVDGWLEAMQLCWKARSGHGKQVGAISAYEIKNDPERRLRCRDITSRRAPMYGALWMTAWDVIEDIGALDEGYEIGGHEDRDLWERMNHYGYRLYRSGWCRHANRSTLNCLPEKEMILRRNAERFAEAWGVKRRNEANPAGKSNG